MHTERNLILVTTRKIPSYDQTRKKNGKQNSVSVNDSIKTRRARKPSNLLYLVLLPFSTDTTTNPHTLYSAFLELSYSSCCICTGVPGSVRSKISNVSFSYGPASEVSVENSKHGILHAASFCWHILTNASHPPFHVALGRNHWLQSIDLRQILLFYFQNCNILLYYILPFSKQTR
jgi:hypothetical protein